MKIGLLICDHVKPELAEKYGNYKSMFHSALKAAEASLEIQDYWVIDNQLPDDINECDVYLATGSKYSVNDDFEWLNNLKQFIRNLYSENKGFIGICFGHQLIAVVLGGEVAISKNGWGIGVSEVPVSENELLADLNGRISLRVSHREQIVRMPENSRVLAGNDFCANFIMQTGQYFLGIQGHPEFSKDYAEALVLSRQKIIPNTTVEAAIESLKNPVDNLKILQIALKYMHKSIDTVPSS